MVQQALTFIQTIANTWRQNITGTGNAETWSYTFNCCITLTNSLSKDREMNGISSFYFYEGLQWFTKISKEHKLASTRFPN